jgi:carbon storage regulator CsrA
MLVLTRQLDEEIVINVPGVAPIVLRIVMLNHGKVRIGFKADLSVTIHRREVQDRIDSAERRTA